MDSDPTLRNVQQPQRQAANPFNVGQVLDGKYEILSLLGVGGMGAVYRARHLLLNTEVALKTLDTERLADTTSSRRFLTEAKAAFSLKHPNLINVYDFGVLADGHPFLVMELVHGKTLQSIVEEKGKLSLSDIADFFPQICFGLAYAHQHQVVHRDIKPANIMIVDGLPLHQEGSVKILDFGIAKIVNDDRGEMQTLTQTGEIFGSPYYMSPEQCSGDSIDRRSDVYSVGCVLFELLTGTPPHVGSNALRTMMLHVNDEAPSLKEAALGAEFSDDLERIVKKMLAKSPADRYEDLGEVAHEIFIACGGTKSISSEVKVVASAKRQSAASEKANTITVSYVQLGFWILATATSASLATSFFEQLVFNQRPYSADAKKELINAPTLHSEETRLRSEFLRLAAKAKGAFTQIPPIAAHPVAQGRWQVVFPDPPLAEVAHYEYGKLVVETAKGTMTFPTNELLMTINGDTYPYVFSESFVFEKIDPGLINHVDINGFDKLFEFVQGDERGKLLTVQKQGLAEILSAASKWKRLWHLGLCELELTAAMIDDIDKMPLTNLTLNTLKCPAHAWQGRKVLTRLEYLALENCDSNGILKEIFNSKTLTMLSVVGGNTLPETIAALGSCKRLEVLTLYDEKVPAPVVTAASELNNVRELRFRSGGISPAQVKAISKNWCRQTSSAPKDLTMYFKRR